MSDQELFSQQGGGLHWTPEIAHCLETTCDDYSRADGFNMISHSLRADGFDASEDGTGRGTQLVAYAADDYKTGSFEQTDVSRGLTTSADRTRSAPIVTATLVSEGDAHSGFRDEKGLVTAFAQNQRDEVREMDVAGALASEPGMKQQTYIKNAMAVRRLTPRECERLQGFQDDYTLIKFRGKPAADGPRYKALGNSWAVPVVRWIGQRIEQVNRARS